MKETSYSSVVHHIFLYTIIYQEKENERNFLLLELNKTAELGATYAVSHFEHLTFQFPKILCGVAW